MKKSITRNMRILFLSDNFPPEVNAPANRTFEHCREWVRQGHTVTVITCAPNFPAGRLMAGYRNRILSKEVFEGIHVWRVWSYIAPNQGKFRRVLDYISFALTSLMAGVFARKDLIVATSPQFFTALAGYLLSLLSRKPWVFEVRDLWPESIEAVGAIKRGMVIDLLSRIELFLYRRSSLIVVVAKSFRRSLIERGIEERKIAVIENGVDLTVFKPTERDEELRRDLGLEGKLAIMYAGTIGMAHALDFIVRCAARLPPTSNIHFLFIGDGAHAHQVQKLISQLGVKNVSLLPPVPHYEMPRYWSIADFALVNLKATQTFKSVLPSKIFECAAMEIPILLGVSGEAHDLIERYRAGLAFEPEDYPSFLNVIDSLMSSDKSRNDYKAGCRQLADDFDRNMLAMRMLQAMKNLVLDSSHSIT